MDELHFYGNEVSCGYCGAQLKSDEKFCRSCGKRVEYIFICPYCSQELSGNERFCPHCDSFLRGKTPNSKTESDATQYKYCKNCGRKVRQSATKCAYCDKFTDFLEKDTGTTTYGKINVFAVVGFVLSFFVPILGWIFSTVGRKKAKEICSGNAIATWGIVISSVILGIQVPIVIWAMGFFIYSFIY